MTDRPIEEVLAEIADLAEVERDRPKARRRNKAPAKEPSQVYALRIPANRLESIRALAAERNTQPTAMLREWVLQRLEQEMRSDVAIDSIVHRINAGPAGAGMGPVPATSKYELFVSRGGPRTPTRNNPTSATKPTRRVFSGS